MSFHTNEYKCTQSFSVAALYFDQMYQNMLLVKCYLILLKKYYLIFTKFHMAAYKSLYM